MDPYKRFVLSIDKYSTLIEEESSKSWKNINTQQNEPEIILDYLTQPQVGVDYLNSKIASVISSNTTYEVKFASVFCHKKPTVTRIPASFKECQGEINQKGCELGDLSILFIFMDKNKNPIFSNAHIFQAKRNHGPDNKTQICLYENDDSFEMPANIKPFTSVPKNFQRFLPKYSEHRIKALSYLLLVNTVPDILQIPYKSNLMFSWHHVIHRILINDFGLPFHFQDTKTAGDWDTIISDLTNSLSGKIYKGKDRVTGLDFLINQFNFFFFYPEYKLTFDNEGIPTILILVKDKEFEIG